MVLMTQNDLTTGPATDKQKDAPVKPARAVEIWAGEPPQKDGKIEQVFQIQKECKFRDPDTGKECKAKLYVDRVKNQKFIRDKTKDGRVGGGGVLDYDETDIRQYVYCQEHGTKGPSRW